MKPQRNINVQVCHCESRVSRDVTIPMEYEKPQRTQRKESSYHD